MSESNHTADQVGFFFDGELDKIQAKYLLAHCRQCLVCRGALYDYMVEEVISKKGIEATVSNVSDYQPRRGNCLNLETFEQYVLGNLSDEDKCSVERHLNSGCGDCQRELEFALYQTTSSVEDWSDITDEEWPPTPLSEYRAQDEREHTEGG